MVLEPRVSPPQNEATWRGAETGLRSQPTSRSVGTGPWPAGPRFRAIHPACLGPILGLLGGRGGGGWLSNPPVPPQAPAPSLPRPAPARRARARGLAFAALSSAPPGGLGRESAEQQFPPQSRSVLSKPSRPAAFFSNDSAAREWEGLSPRLGERDQGLWHEIPRGRLAEGGQRGWGRGSPRVLGGGEGSWQLGGAAAAFLCTARLSQRRPFPPAPEGGAAKQKDRKWRWESRSPWRRASSGQQLTCMC